jgi:hypothetical protein
MNLFCAVHVRAVRTGGGRGIRVRHTGDRVCRAAVTTYSGKVRDQFRSLPADVAAMADRPGRMRGAVARELMALGVCDYIPLSGGLRLGSEASIAVFRHMAGRCQHRGAR